MTKMYSDVVYSSPVSEHHSDSGLFPANHYVARKKRNWSIK